MRSPGQSPKSNRRPRHGLRPKFRNPLSRHPGKPPQRHSLRLRPGKRKNLFPFSRPPHLGRRKNRLPLSLQLRHLIHRNRLRQSSKLRPQSLPPCSARHPLPVRAWKAHPSLRQRLPSRRKSQFPLSRLLPSRLRSNRNAPPCSRQHPPLRKKPSLPSRRRQRRKHHPPSRHLPHNRSKHPCFRLCKTKNPYPLSTPRWSHPHFPQPRRRKMPQAPSKLPRCHPPRRKATMPPPTGWTIFSASSASVTGNPSGSIHPGVEKPDKALAEGGDPGAYFPRANV